jgi:hypothetical protein
LLEIAELFPDWRAEAQCRAEFLAAQTKCPPGGRRIVHRITQDRVWEPLPISPMNAGLRLLRIRRYVSDGLSCRSAGHSHPQQHRSAGRPGPQRSRLRRTS